MLTSLDKRINKVLLKTELLTAEKSQEIIALSSKEKKPFIGLLIDNKVVGEETLLSALCVELNLAPVVPDRVSLDEKVVSLIPEKMCMDYSILPLSKIGNILTVAVSDPFDVVKLDDVRLLTRCEVRVVLSLERWLKPAITRAYHPEEHGMDKFTEDMADEETVELELSKAAKESKEEDERLDLSQLSDDGSGSPVVRLVNVLLMKAIEQSASDIHIEPYEKKVSVRFRVDGVMQEVLSPPKRLHNAVASRIKIISHLDIAERHLPQDGKFQIKKSNRRVDVRVAIIPTVHGERVVLRILDSSSLVLRLEDLGFEPDDFNAFKKAIDASYGMVLISGPTGCGKTTTLYCAVKEISDPQDNLITVEDPVEYQLPGIIQVSVNPKQGLTFASALRSILRQDPDIIMIGEMRDLETADIAVKAAITGHLVFSTLHTNDSVSTILRLADMGIDRFMISSAVLLVVNQRLLRKLCAFCKTPVTLHKERLISVGFTPQEVEESKLFGPSIGGCTRCTGGYKGRTAVYEVLALDDEIKRLIINDTSPFEIKDYAINKLSLTTLRRASILKAIKGITSLDEVMKNS
ncbi:MAG: ATPase, T2SS/T4P/T4SS family [Planctomycetota bacterium]|nr:ATPase, T2SS/T4P/T4SS family [Planctomycetota bacterium]MDI6787209.1 ATPase, T2SS/T4P/T4SS family [Planctomycetota bacterium]